MAGTFLVKSNGPFSLSANWDYVGTTDGFWRLAFNVGAGTCNFVFFNTLSLDGGPEIAWSGLPVGFTIISAVIQVLNSIAHDQNGNPPPPGGPSAILTNSFLPPSFSYNNPPDFLTSKSISLPISNIDLLTLLGSTCVISANSGTGVIDANKVTVKGVQADKITPTLSSPTIHISGTYDIEQFQWTLENPTTPVRVGDKVKILSSIPTAITDIILTITDPITKKPKTIDIPLDSNYVIFWSLTEFWFYLPIELGTFTGLLLIDLVGDGTQFSGSVFVGSLQVLFEDASGIYSLVPSQTNDILYFRAGYITDTKLIELPDIREDENLYDDDFFSLLAYPTKILSETDVNDDYTINDYSIISILRTVVVLTSVEIPSPFVRTAFLP